MTAAERVAAVLWLGTMIYAIFGGADFGAGVWDLLAGNGKRGADQRELIDRAMGPVWEANHTWLIFDLVILWSAFPGAFAAIMSTLYLPLALAAVGIVLRGSGFAFRKVSHRLTGRRVFGLTFALSSIITPFLLGTVLGAIASGRVPAAGNGDPIGSWLNPTSIAVGLLAVAAGAYIAGAFLTADARRSAPALVDVFRRRTLGAGIVAGGLAIAGILVLRLDAPSLFAGLTGPALPFVAVSVAAGSVSLALCAVAGGRGTRGAAVAAVASVVLGWGIAQYPMLLPPDLSIAAGAAPDGTLAAMTVITIVAAAVIGPSLALLFWLQQQSRLESKPEGGPGISPGSPLPPSPPPT
jgi:cytochrome bd ubiquinol oxidase subunit II